MYLQLCLCVMDINYQIISTFFFVTIAVITFVLNGFARQGIFLVYVCNCSKYQKPQASITLRLEYQNDYISFSF